MTADAPAAVRTHQGGHPHANEDSAYAAPGLAVVADGMGGHAGGEVASAAAVAAVREVVEPELAGLRRAEAADLLGRAVDAAAHALRRAGEADEALATMGTTLVVAVVVPDGVPLEGGGAPQPHLVVANVGDSRAYLLPPVGRLQRLTRDDNVAEELLGLGLIDAGQAASHPGQYQLTKAVTAYDPAPPLPRFTEVPAVGRLLLCSDGLTGELDDAAVAGLLARGTADEAAQALVDAAVRAPARDNVTAVVVDLGPRED